MEPFGYGWELKIDLMDCAVIKCCPDSLECEEYLHCIWIYFTYMYALPKS